MDPDWSRPGLGDEPIDGIDAQILELSQRWQGPLPMPGHLAEYDQILPGTADRIIRMAENSANAQIETLRDTTKATIDYEKSGQSLAFLLTLIAIGAAIVFFALGNEIAGACFLSVPVLMLIKSFLPQRDQAN